MLAGLAVAGLIALSGCGAAGAPPAVASVQGSNISQDALAHWMGIKRAELQSGSGSAAAVSSAELRRKALAFLIGATWLDKEAAAEGISVSSAEVNQTYQELLSSLAGPAFSSGLTRRGMSSADELLQLRSTKLAGKLRDKSMAGNPAVSAAEVTSYYDTHASQFRRSGQTLPAATPAIHQILVQRARQQQFSAFLAAFRQRWKQRTVCEPGYVIAECRNGPPLSASPAD